MSSTDPVVVKSEGDELVDGDASGESAAVEEETRSGGESLDETKPQLPTGSLKPERVQREPEPAGDPSA